ncbi:VOC family protein [Caulobacter mirabilis]|uniref:Glyoxalase n=1 Tax=Caulobacter mirabilis TaxID=69666 RepID=A0A2D2AU68_9CAUL|nr:VOC family protein [Caulobacter mirabilis]ATQ41517.1 glyoxalase [Caulobacter mirabilis]
MAFQQQLSVVTLGVADLIRSKRFYVDGFGWRPVFENEEIVFYQMNGFVLGTWLHDKLAEDMRRPLGVGRAPFSLGHNVRTREEVRPILDRLAAHGGTLLKPPVEPPFGGLQGYVADPDDHAWDIVWNPGFRLGDDGSVTFGV